MGFVELVDPFGSRLRPGPGAAFVVLVAFLLSFLAIRTSARLTRSVSWWPGGVQSGGVHLHHLVWGICLMLLCGFQFALWVRLEDVYWAEEGRASFDAVVCTCAFALLVVVGTRPFGLDEPASIAGTALAIGAVAALAIVCFAKGRVLLGIVGVFVPVVALVGAVRLGKPNSPWAHWRYDEARLERARRRFAGDRPLARTRRRAADAIAGAPNEPT
jgi:hypothetical protein